MNLKYVIAILVSAMWLIPANAESWDYIRTSGEYYYGIGFGKTEPEADQAALADMISRIATHVSSDFTQIDDISNRNGKVDHNSRVLNCIKTYSQTTLTNTEKWVDGKEPKVTVRRYMKKSELARIFENRIEKARNMLRIADECLAGKKIDMALQYYYWSYSLIRSVQFPDEVKSDDGKTLVDWIPVKIDEILDDIVVEFEGKDGNYTDLLFKYRNEPVSTLEFSYSDGRSLCQGLAKDGRGMLEMVPEYETDVYHIDIEYEHKSQARGDAEMESVLNVITPKTFPKAAIKVNARKTKKNPVFKLVEESSPASVNKKISDDTTDVNREQVDRMVQSHIMDELIKAISTKNYSDASQYFTVDGLEMYNKLISYGKARIVDTSEIKYYKGLGGRTVVRGLQMSFSFAGKKKTTFVEDVSFTFDSNNRIENVAFGIGKTAEDGIFNKNAPGWRDDVRETIVEFMENYKTAYNLERLDYISSIFSDDAVIIIGNIAKPKTRGSSRFDGLVSLSGRDIIRYNRLTKRDYIENLRRCFMRNEFINLRFSEHQIQWLEKFDDQAIFAINIRQEYCSSTYADDGYLFLLVDMTNPEEPQIKIRTWQPNEVAIEKLYNAGDFFND